MKLKLSLLSAALIGCLFMGCKDASPSISSQEETATLKEPTIEMTNAVGVYDLKKDQAYRNKAKELDLKCPNLLDPKISKDEIDLINKEWAQLNQTVGQYLVTNDFDWDTEATTVRVWHKFYFNKNGQITSYYYNILGDNISQEVRDAYGASVSEIIGEQSVNIQKDSAFAQCGSMRFPVL